MRIKDFDKLNYKSHFELYWCEGEDVLDLIKSLIEFVQETKIDDKVYFMFKGNFSGQDYQYYPDDEVLDAAPSKVISEWDDEYSYADVGDCSKEFFDETQPIIEADGSIYSITIDEYNTKTFKRNNFYINTKLYIDYIYTKQNDIFKLAIDTAFPYVNLMLGSTYINGEQEFNDFSYGLSFRFKNWMVLFGNSIHENAAIGSPTSFEIRKYF